ncbi:MAG: MFS transporter [Nitrospinae bacterium]|nr:MFS transporter [Nitrospinota bacterium]
MAPSKIFNLFAIAGSHAVNAFYTQLLIPVLPLIVAEFELNYVQAGLIVTTYSVANSVFQFPLSFISDYTRRWRTVLALSLLTQALPVLLYGYAANYSLLLLFVFIGGIGSAAYHPPAVALITRELPERRGFCTGLFNGGGEMGNIISPAIVGWLAVYLASWRMAAQFYVIPGVIWAALIWFRFQDQLGERLPFRQAARSTFGALFRNKSLMLLIALSSFRIMGFRGFMAFLPLLLAEQFGFDTKGVGWMLSAYFLIGSTMSIIIGRWSDKTGRTKLIVVLTFMCATAMASLTWVASLTTLLLALFAVACILTPVPTLVLAVGTELVDERVRSSSVGMIYGFNEAASALSPLIGGLVAEAMGLQMAFTFYASMFMVGGCIAIFLHRESALQPQVQVSES